MSNDREDWVNERTANGKAGDAQRAKVNREELLGRIALSLPEDGTVEPMKGLRLNRACLRRQSLVTAWLAPPSASLRRGAKRSTSAKRPV